MTDELGADFHFGLPASEHGRVASIEAITADERFRPRSVEEVEAPPGFLPEAHDADKKLMLRNAYFNPPSLAGLGVVNTAPWRESVIPSTSGHGTARGVAQIYSALLGFGPAGPGWIPPELLARATTIHSDGDDEVLGRPSRFGLSFQLAQPTRGIGPNPRAFGHFGYGGTLAFADPDAGIAFAYLMNRPGERWQTPRVTNLVEALYRCPLA